jgi:hypothetical protein
MKETHPAPDSVDSFVKSATVHLAINTHRCPLLIRFVERRLEGFYDLADTISLPQPYSDRSAPPRGDQCHRRQDATSSCQAA